MKVFVIVASLMAMTSARPGGYNLHPGYLPAVQEEERYPDYQQVEEEKNVYFYASPNDEYYTRFRVNVIPKSKKSTKVIFVKAPHHAGVIPEVKAPPSLVEDKTLLYVLVKKPILGQSITIPNNLGIKQNKPEVFFIKYNKKQDAEVSVNNGVNGQIVGSNVPEQPNQFAFLDALDSQRDIGYNYEPKRPIAPQIIDNKESFTHVQLDNDVGQQEVPTSIDIPSIPEIPETPKEEVPPQDSETKTIVKIDEENEIVEPTTTVLPTDTTTESTDNSDSTTVTLEDK